MFRAGSWVPPNLRIIHGLLQNRPAFAADRLGNGYRMTAGIQLFSTKSKTGTKLDANAVNHGNSKVQPPASGPRKPIFPWWAKWVFGSVVTLALPLWVQDWPQLRKIEGEAEVFIGEVGTVAKVVEKVATMAEEVSEKVAEKLPEDGILKGAASVIESVSKVVVQDAKITEDIVHKVDELKEDFDELIGLKTGQIKKDESEGK